MKNKILITVFLLLAIMLIPNILIAKTYYIGIYVRDQFIHDIPNAEIEVFVREKQTSNYRKLIFDGKEEPIIDIRDNSKEYIKVDIDPDKLETSEIIIKATYYEQPITIIHDIEVNLNDAKSQWERSEEEGVGFIERNITSPAFVGTYLLSKQVLGEFGYKVNNALLLEDIDDDTLFKADDKKLEELSKKVLFKKDNTKKDWNSFIKKQIETNDNERDFMALSDIVKLTYLYFGEKEGIFVYPAIKNYPIMRH